ncbi:MAG TPA: NAD(P)H-hydrate dehydratase [Jatrophihabitans sp.]|jgi:hydroxyethylthiazole kinase-like uncharacterized protein yjeF
MKGVYSVAQVRAAEDAASATSPDGVLMQRAATALASECVRLLRARTGRVYGADVVVLIGSGNNGGDALYAGAALARRGARVAALLVDDGRVHGAGLAALRAAGGRVGAQTPAPDLVIDGLLGIGGRGGLTGRAAELAETYADVFTVAVDVPSGVETDTGYAPGAAVQADVTVTFGCLKPGVVLGAGAELAGSVLLADIGLPLPTAECFVPEAHDIAALLPEPMAADDKYSRGVTGVAAGSAAYPGAAVLATGAALHGGGMVRYAGHAAGGVGPRYPEVVVSEPDARVQAWVVGPGIGLDADAVALLVAVLDSDVPVLVDADAITLLAERPELLARRSAPTVLTPHDREFARIAPEAATLLATNRLGAARAAAAALDAVVLLKGSATIVADPGGTAYVNPTGTPWLATAGSGDVLAGYIGSLLASGLPAPLAAAAGAYVHGVAGQLAAADGPPTSADVLAALRPAIHSVALA